MRGRISLLVATVAALAAMTTAAEPPAVLIVRHADVRFLNRSGTRDSLVLDAMFPTVTPLATSAFDPAKDDVVLTVGSSDTFRVGPGDLAAVRGRRTRLLYRSRGRSIDASDRVRSLVVDLASGKTRAQVRRSGAFELRSGSHLNVPVKLGLGASEFAGAVDFGVKSGGRTWRGPAKVSFPPEGSSESSQIQDERTVVIRDADAWAAFWLEHRGPTATPPMPVDFSTEIVFAVVRIGTGIGLAIDGQPALEADKAIVHFSVYEPGPDCVVPQMISFLAAFARLPRTDLPVEFVEHRRVYDCGQ